MALDLAEIFVAGAGRAILGDQLLHQVVDRLEVRRLRGGVPGRHAEDVVAGARLLLGRTRQHQLVALRGDEVDRDLDLLLVRPFAAELGQGVVGARHPMVPEADGELARRGCLQEAAPRQPCLLHVVLPRSNVSRC
jgi:hypothetical protein